MTTTPSPAFHLAGNHAPVDAERTAHDLPVTGTLPPELTGWFVRNGPNPRTPSAHWFLGDGMLHTVRIEDGRAAWYRNRWVRTKAYEDPAARLYRADGTRDLAVGPANTHVVRHAGRTFALVESSLPYEIACTADDLTTLGPYDFGGRLADSMTAHPKICPDTGELHFFSYGSITPPYVTYHRADARGQLTVSRPVDVPAHVMMHDFALTSRHVVLLDLPVVFDLRKAVSGGGGMPYGFDPGHGARIGLLRRDDPYGKVVWCEIEPCYVFHTLNAHEDAAGRVVLHGVRYPHLWWEGHDHPASHLWRWTLDPVTAEVREEQLDDRDCEFPRIDDRLAGREAAYGYAVDAGDAEHGGTLLRYGLRGDVTAETFAFGPGRVPGEAVHVPGGWLMTYVHDHATGLGELVVLAADRIAEGPVARVHLPWRVPYGFHGNWLPDDARGASV
ncbi:carotenoid oxygenase family protein [Streptomyces sp. VRA16 Mangrove soil]|uniref:carotenoid oxygenase family protein n=1 Tax=Streptomyces sp. VRA16 Mangrove soil TaxID=2817434 RepID=UPI001A9CE614|nr:carotenoid oxygenase family protein [Streptomyces sp. VRA16 Mangrove soil]MBO1334680.1 carotenoid oxygenase family protein [Streptomyces sp. VRA16 Mangrove soil]